MHEMIFLFCFTTNSNSIYFLGGSVHTYKDGSEKPDDCALFFNWWCFLYPHIPHIAYYSSQPSSCFAQFPSLFFPSLLDPVFFLQENNCLQYQWPQNLGHFLFLFEHERHLQTHICRFLRHQEHIPSVPSPTPFPSSCGMLGAGFFLLGHLFFWHALSFLHLLHP